MPVRRLKHEKNPHVLGHFLICACPSKLKMPPHSPMLRHSNMSVAAQKAKLQELWPGSHMSSSSFSGVSAGCQLSSVTTEYSSSLGSSDSTASSWKLSSSSPSSGESTLLSAQYGALKVCTTSSGLWAHDFATDPLGVATPGSPLAVQAPGMEVDPRL